MEKFSKIFGSLVFFLIHKTKMNCEKNFALKKLEVTPEAFIVVDTFIIWISLKNAPKTLFLENLTFRGQKMIFT